MTKLLVWVFTWYYPTIKDPAVAIGHTVKLFQRYADTRGYLWAVARFKLMRLHTTRVISGQPLDGTENIALTRDRLPKALGPMKAWVRSGQPEALSATLTLLTLGRALRHQWLEPDLSPVTAPSTASESLVREILDFAQRFIKDYRIKLDPVWSNLHWTTKSGPYGPALWTSLSDFRNLSPKMKEDIKVIGGPTLNAYLSSLHEVLGDRLDALADFFNPKGKGKSPRPLRKLSLVRDKEAKTRIIAILDYWSQTALAPLHQEIFKVLRRLPSDRTFAQGKLEPLISRNGPFFSFDLSSATDRFPILLQTGFLKQLIGVDRAEAWERILVSEGYTPSWKPDSTYFYGAGQPMGAYSSWPVFTLSHHLVVQFSAYRVNKYPFADYLLLGDDIVIADRDVASSYKDVITHLGVTISEQKSHASEDTFEFAKRWFHKGTEITPFPLGSLVESAAGYVPLAETIRDALRKGLQPKQMGIAIDVSNPGFCVSLFKAFGKPTAFAGRLAYKLRAVLLFPTRAEMVVETADAFLRHFGVHVSCNMRLASVARRFEQVAALVKAKEMSKEIDSLARFQAKWFNHLNLVIGPLGRDMGSPPQTISDSEILPIAKVLDSKIIDLSRMKESLRKPKKEDVHKLLYEEPLLRFPDLDRIDPSRQMMRILGGQARLLFAVATYWKQWEAELKGHQGCTKEKAPVRK